MKTIHIFLIFFLCAVTSIIAQSTLQTQIGPPYIEVIGTAEKKVIPDEIYLSITIRERQENREKVTIEKQEEDLKAAIQGLGIPLDNLMLSDANANFVRIKWTKKDVVAKVQYLLKVGDAETLGKVLDELDDLKIRNAYISRVDHSKMDELRKEVRIMAIKAAKAKADYLLEAIGEKTGKAVEVREVDQTQAPLQGAMVNTRSSSLVQDKYYIDGMTVGGSGGKPLQFRKITIMYSIYTNFEIGEKE